MTPFERRVAQRPDPHELWEFQTEDGRLLRGAYPDGDTIDDEFAALWRTVIELEPMIDSQTCGTSPATTTDDEARRSGGVRGPRAGDLAWGSICCVRDHRELRSSA